MQYDVDSLPLGEVNAIESSLAVEPSGLYLRSNKVLYNRS